MCLPGLHRLMAEQVTACVGIVLVDTRTNRVGIVNQTMQGFIFLRTPGVSKPRWRVRIDAVRKPTAEEWRATRELGEPLRQKPVDSTLFR
ncbi:hypothetical protein OHV05_20990 [Kitasatospora sp. NBC_00070]|uniref:hypothetical protein n=1 Tax=Kitasatospora sp. NBC_00070 TaxID=2975962 RepID=UPI0032462FDA